MMSEGRATEAMDWKASVLVMARATPVCKTRPGVSQQTHPRIVAEALVPGNNKRGALRNAYRPGTSLE